MWIAGFESTVSATRYAPERSKSRRNSYGPSFVIRGSVGDDPVRQPYNGGAMQVVVVGKTAVSYVWTPTTATGCRGGQQRTRASGIARRHQHTGVQSSGTRNPPVYETHPMRLHCIHGWGGLGLQGMCPCIGEQTEFSADAIYPQLTGNEAWSWRASGAGSRLAVLMAAGPCCWDVEAGGQADVVVAAPSSVSELVYAVRNLFEPPPFKLLQKGMLQRSQPATRCSYVHDTWVQVALSIAHSNM
ncbi:hypothetical protein CC86DRAFT_387161 [Ophiobolus disseminans]|uniref:Uncharacterized protein n=1 Tax=Ophiobolus disseminans TaxID=1469910 RepID=A0A6A6ZK43_9PLEO|nr:hypothetical protein CC86DRAFT_387161 [Ophiobolus disseminans]